MGVKKVFYWFTQYVDGRERKVAKFFVKASRGSGIFTLRRHLLELMQSDLIVLTLWVERNFKGYRYLKSKRRRRKLYKVRDVLVADFEGFVGDVELSKRKYMEKIMEYLRVGGRYHYLETSTFCNLIRNPAVEGLEGDCNQIVTLYIYLYSLRFSIEDLKIKLLEGHVCLHFDSRDIEATRGEYVDYADFKAMLGVEEIVVLNILDLHDFREEVVDVGAIDLLDSAEFCYKFGSLREVVAANLKVAYHNFALYRAKNNDFKEAILFAKKVKDRELLRNIYLKAVRYFVDKKAYSKAYEFAKTLQDGEWIDHIGRLQIKGKIGRGQFDAALKIARRNGTAELVNAVYGAQYNYFLTRVKSGKLGPKSRRDLIFKMSKLLSKMGRHEDARKLVRELK
ncbi:hypothetical protein CVV38_03440 [Candidatus Peregrinibacteria bacterium HGW-Peregrinibacteria-1]|jgi:tetratricopeptide (TPR) repeat protein|nr:MAG: hypothetical protein CVV38_03440 [Candidatus Peregrinibacteria bacterium HGW-Peregrinibacteria-1]